MATNIGDIYDRAQQRINLEDMTEERFEEWLEANFKKRKTKHSGVVDLTKDHTITEFKDNRKGKKRTREVKGITPNLGQLVSGLLSLRDQDVEVEIQGIREGELDRMEGRQITESDERRIIGKIGKYDKVRDTSEDLQFVQDLVQEKEFVRELSEKQEEQQRIAELSREEKRKMLEGEEEERRLAIRALRKLSPQSLGGFIKAERAKGRRALRELD